MTEEEFKQKLEEQKKEFEESNRNLQEQIDILKKGNDKVDEGKITKEEFSQNVEDKITIERFYRNAEDKSKNIKRYGFIFIAMLTVLTTVILFIYIIVAVPIKSDAVKKNNDDNISTKEKETNRYKNIGEQNRQTYQDEVVEEPEIKPDLEILDSETTSGKYGNVYITGRVKNNSGMDYSYIRIIWDLLDKDGYVIGTAMDNNSGLRVDEIWKFKAIVIDENPARYRLNEVSGRH